MILVTLIKNEMYSIEYICDGRSVLYKQSNLCEINQSLRVAIIRKHLDECFNRETGYSVVIFLSDL
jgi:hypothetical protein